VLFAVFSKNLARFSLFAEFSDGFAVLLYRAFRDFTKNLAQFWDFEYILQFRRIICYPAEPVPPDYSLSGGTSSGGSAGLFVIRQNHFSQESLLPSQ
jgi:hypothetical protein